MKIYGNTGGDAFSRYVMLLGAIAMATGAGSAYLGGLALVGGVVAFAACAVAMLVAAKRYDVMREVPHPLAAKPAAEPTMKGESDLAWSTKNAQGEALVDPAFLPGGHAVENRPMA